MRKVFTTVYALSTFGAFLRSLAFSHLRQRDAVASRFVVALTCWAPIVSAPTDGQIVFIDVDATIIEIHGRKKQGAKCGTPACTVSMRCWRRYRAHR